MSENVPEKARLVDLQGLLVELEKLDWSAGLTREQLSREMPAFPREVYLLLPSEREFRGPQEVVTYYRHAWAKSQSEGVPAMGAAEDGGPAAWGASPTSTGGKLVGGVHGVGSGADSGFTGSTEVGVDRSGATYGPGSEEAEED